MQEYPPPPKQEHWQSPNQYTQYPPQQSYPPQYQPPPPPQWPPQQPPQYQSPYPPQMPPKKRGVGNFLAFGCVGLVILVALIIAIAVATSSGNSNTPTLDVTSQAAQPTQQVTRAAQPTSPPTTFAVGNQVDVGSWRVSVNSVKTNQGDAVFSPKSGDIFLVFDVTVDNASSSPQLVSSAASFILKDSTGLAYNETVTDFGTPPDGTVQAGDKLRGQIIYEVPVSEHHFTFQFQDSVYYGRVATWRISV